MHARKIIVNSKYFRLSVSEADKFTFIHLCFEINGVDCTKLNGKFLYKYFQKCNLLIILL